MSTTETTQSRHYRLEVRQGIAGWRAYARGPQGIEWQSPRPWALREEALEEGREALRGIGLDAWDEWMDGVTDNHFDPRVSRQLTVDAIEEAKRAGVTLPDPEAQAEASRRLKELDEKRQAATRAAQEKVVTSPDAGLGAEDPPQPESPLKAQRKKSAVMKEEGEG